MSLTAHAGLVVFVAALSVTPAKHAHAQAAPPSYRSNTYYAAHGAEIAALFAASAVLNAYADGGNAGADPSWFPGDLGRRAQRNERARALSDALVALTLALPTAFTLDDGSGARFVNSQLVYAETLSLNLWLNSVVKYVARRPRPLSYAPRPSDDRSDYYVSFYSSHASMAFSAATSGAYLFSEGASDPGSRLMLWGIEFMLAGATANLRVRAGKHYYSDVLVGAVVGTGLGFGVPSLHGARRRPEPAEFAAALLGLGVGVGLSQVIPFAADDADPELAWTYTPLLAPQALGLQAQRRF